ncbi:MAG TPA: 50S ribosomal protein L13 [Candidatus Aminicenantes bacterium]|nr:MAG: 50S ribosomal protein L13 [Candidatus Aminicenantes bacterium]HEK85403.1 50S ribosomal protein L13 [Candidatus Aminicenantes bacterium]
MKTYHPKREEIQQKWWLINADGQILGRLATEIAILLRGKNKPQFAPSVDTGDFVVVINAEKIKTTGNKIEDKIYYSHSLYPGGLKEKKLKEMLAAKPEEVIRRAVWGMIPKNKLGRAVIKKLKIYRGPEHPHQAQNPEEYKI